MIKNKIRLTFKMYLKPKKMRRQQSVTKVKFLSKRQMFDLMCHIEISRSKRVDIMDMNVIDNEALARCNVETSTNSIDRMSKLEGIQ